MSDSVTWPRHTPAWFDEAKLGIFITWSAGAIPAFAPTVEMYDMPEGEDAAVLLRRLPYAHEYQNTMLIEGSATARHHAERYGDLPYDAFVERFRDEMIPRFDPEPLADIIARSGARYAVHYVRLNDGFLPWPSAHPNPHRENWQSERDVVGEICTAIRARGIRVGLGYPGGMDWSFHGLPIRTGHEMVAATHHGAEYVAYVDAHWRELIDRYEPAILWNDYCYPRGGDVAGLLDYYVSRVPDGVINNRWGEHIDVMAPFEPYSDFITPEYRLEGASDVKWEAIRAIGSSFGYNREESERTYLSAEQLIQTFVDIVARGGNLLLGVSPTATGEIPWAQAERLQALGWWLRINGGAIFGTRPWEKRVAGLTEYAVGVRYTASADAVHAIVLGAPRDPAVDLDVRLAPGARVQLEGRRGELAWESSPCGTRIRLPEPPAPQPALSFRLSPRAAVDPFDET